jgi:hypothetical protein
MRRSIRSFSFILVVASLCLVPTACGGGGGGGGSSAHQNTATMDPDVIVLQSGTTLRSFDATSVTLTGTLPTLAPGNIIVSQEGDGLMRKVVSTSTSGADLVVQTEQAGLSDIFTDADILVKQKLDLDSFTVVSSAPGVTLNTISKGGRDFQRTISFNNLTIATPTEPIAASVVINGEANLIVDFEWIYREENDIMQEVGMKVTPAVLSDLTATCAIKATGSKDFEYLHLMGPIVSIPVGPIVIPVRPELKCKAGISASGEVGFEMKSTLAFTTTMGVKGVATSTGDLVPQTIFNFTKSGQLDVLKNVYGSAKAEVSPLNAELSLLILGITGPFVSGKAFAFEGELRHDALPPRKVTATLTKVHAFTAGVKGEFLGTELFNLETTLAEQKDVIRTFEFLPGDGSVVID